MQKVYWDSDCFLGWLQEEADKQALCKQVISEAEVGNLKILTSALTIAEVLMLKGHDRIPADRSAVVRDFFKQPYISVRSLTRRTAELAQSLVWSSGVYPKDAVHVATALEAETAVIHTFDERLIKKSGLVGGAPLVIQKPSVRAPQLDLGGSGGRKK